MERSREEGVRESTEEELEMEVFGETMREEDLRQ